jgi:hypothetical protein
MDSFVPQESVSPVTPSRNLGVWPYVLGAFLVVALGVGGAWIVSTKLLNNSARPAAAPGVKATSTEAGVLDPKIKYDDATGDLKEGGINGQGTHHLERDGGASHYVYLTSSVVDLSKFTGKKVQVWGQTLASKKAGWLMDVAKIKIAE